MVIRKHLREAVETVEPMGARLLRCRLKLHKQNLDNSGIRTASHKNRGAKR